MFGNRVETETPEEVGRVARRFGINPGAAARPAHRRRAHRLCAHDLRALPTQGPGTHAALAGMSVPVPRACLLHTCPPCLTGPGLPAEAASAELEQTVRVSPGHTEPGGKAARDRRGGHVQRTETRRIKEESRSPTHINK